MVERLVGRVETGARNANVWLDRFNAAYARKLGTAVFPGTLNLHLPHLFDWSSPRYAAALISFDRAEYGGERDILLLPCRLESLHNHPAFLWTTTTPRSGADLSLVELITDLPLRETFGLIDGDAVTVDLELRGELGWVD